MSEKNFQLVHLCNGTRSVRALDYGETMHPGLGPAAEAEALYVNQLRLVERLREQAGEFVVWDVGLGAAANALALLRAARDCDGLLRLVSFDNSPELLRFALQNAAQLGYLEGFSAPLMSLLENRAASFHSGALRVEWEFVMADFPAWLRSAAAARAPKPHAIFFDPYSPARNPAMWTAALFADLFSALDAARPCALATYSRSTMTRTALLLAGFHVGVGRATGPKEETTVAANTPALLAEPLDHRWLERARRSHGAEPLREDVYRQAPLSAETWTLLAAHRQFQRA